MKDNRSRYVTGALSFGVALTLGFSVAQVVASETTSSAQTEIESQIESGQRLPILQRRSPNGPSSIQQDGSTQRLSSAGIASTEATIKTLDQRISEHAEVISLRQGLTAEANARFDSDTVIKQRIDAMDLDVGSNTSAIGSNTGQIGALQGSVGNNANSINRIDGDVNTLSQDMIQAQQDVRTAQQTADNAGSIANMADARADSAYSIGSSADTRSTQNETDIANLDIGGNAGTDLSGTFVKTYEEDWANNYCAKYVKQSCYRDAYKTWTKEVRVSETTNSSGQCVSREILSVRNIETGGEVWRTTTEIPEPSVSSVIGVSCG